MDQNQLFREMLSGLNKQDPRYLDLSFKLRDTDAEIYKEIPFDRIDEPAFVRCLLIKGHKIKAISSRINEFRQLEWLEVSENPLIELPEEIGELDNLRMLKASDTASIDIDSLTFKGLPRRPKAYLDNRGIKKIPDAIGNLQELLSLFLGNNRLTTLPDALGQLKNLESLDLAMNQIRALPDSIGGLENLKYLNLSFNELHYLPPSIGRLQNLQRLRLDGMHFFELPESIGELENLNMLELCNAKVDSFPASMKNLNSLEYLFLNNSEVSAIDLNMIRVFLPDTAIITRAHKKLED